VAITSIRHIDRKPKELLCVLRTEQHIYTTVDKNEKHPYTEDDKTVLPLQP
jgi:hypothetical protein